MSDQNEDEILRELRRRVRQPAFDDGHPIARSKDHVTKDKYNSKPVGREGEYRTVGSMLASGAIQFEIARGMQYDKIGQALRVIQEQQARATRQTPRIEVIKASKPKSIKTGDTVRRTDTREKFLVIKASVDTSDSGHARHLVVSIKTSKQYKISGSMLEKL